MLQDITDCESCGGTGEGEQLSEDRFAPCKKCRGKGEVYPDGPLDDYCGPEYEADVVTNSILNKEP